MKILSCMQRSSYSALSTTTGTRQTSQHLEKTSIYAQRWLFALQYYRAKILKYLRQVAVITPYLRFTFKYSGAGDDKGDIDLTFRRRSDKMSEPPKARPAFLLISTGMNQADQSSGCPSKAASNAVDMLHCCGSVCREA
jgi:hypothetical protein